MTFWSIGSTLHIAHTLYSNTWNHCFKETIVIASTLGIQVHCTSVVSNGYNWDLLLLTLIFTLAFSPLVAEFFFSLADAVAPAAKTTVAIVTADNKEFFVLVASLSICCWSYIWRINVKADCVISLEWPFIFTKSVAINNTREYPFYGILPQWLLKQSSIITHEQHDLSKYVPPFWLQQHVQNAVLYSYCLP
jgi:hypothetical protein